MIFNGWTISALLIITGEMVYIREALIPPGIIGWDGQSAAGSAVRLFHQLDSPQAGIPA
jgi:hypothetical protein